MILSLIYSGEGTLGQDGAAAPATTGVVIQNPFSSPIEFLCVSLKKEIVPIANPINQHE
jgi:hypothetical protein